MFILETLEVRATLLAQNAKQWSYKGAFLVIQKTKPRKASALNAAIRLQGCGSDGYNKNGVNYVYNLKSLEIRILDPGENDKIYIECGGGPFEIEKIDEPITVRVIPEAVKMIYMPHSKKDTETITNWR